MQGLQTFALLTTMIHTMLPAAGNLCVVVYGIRSKKINI